MEELFLTINYNFKNLDLIKSALSHPSLCYLKSKKCVSYERLELLGDSVLSLIILELLLKEYPDLDEGEISKRKAYLVCTEMLSKIAISINLGKYIFMTAGEEKLDGRKNPKILEDVIEALIGAIYYDSGLEEARVFIEKYWLDLIKNQITIEKDPKSRLQEWLQKHKREKPDYITILEETRKNIQYFTLKVICDGLPDFKSTAKNKKEAEILCANQAIEYIKEKIDKNI